MNILDKRKAEIRKRNARIHSEKVCCKCGGDLDLRCVCRKCGNHERMSAKERIQEITDCGFLFREILKECDRDNSEEFDYDEKFKKCKQESGLNEAVVVGVCKNQVTSFLTIIMDAAFMAGTLSKSNGEKIVRAFEYAKRKKLPVVAFCASGGVRLQEGMSGLVQMAKIDVALMKYKEERVPFISVLTDPTYGGVTASFALMGDVNLIEKGASVGFGGKMLTREVLHENVSDEFQSDEYALNNGEVDIICERRDLMDIVLELLDMFNGENQIGMGGEPEYDYEAKEPEQILHELRKGEKPVGIDYLDKLFDERILLEGDRLSHADSSIMCGLGKTSGMKTVFVIQNKGRNLAERKKSNYGMTSPEGYRKTMRTVGLAERFQLPVLILIDSPGAYAGDKAERNCQCLAISESMMALFRAKTRIVTIVVGEGCSGGALALSISDALGMFSGAIYSVISPESYMAIMKKQQKNFADVLTKMKLTARDLYEAGLIDAVLKEGELDYNVDQIKKYYKKSLMDLNAMEMKQILKRRYNRIRNWDKNE